MSSARTNTSTMAVEPYPATAEMTVIVITSESTESEFRTTRTYLEDSKNKKCIYVIKMF